ncbi:DUF6507 family protein [Microbacterium sp. LWH10-1.2]|uniref:DUF6507 family protein n=1 Tax=unclassified Microbacterium TaxID=2609290 RepID=UPI00313A1C95
MMDGWSVAPDQVVGVLAAVDREGEPLEAMVIAASDLLARKADLVAGGRSVLSDAWSDFLDLRSLIPGKAIDVIASSAQAIVEGTTAIAAGDDEMAAEWQAKNSQSFVDGWGSM